MASRSTSPLLPLAWGFVALVPVPLASLLYAESESLAQRSELILAAIFVGFAGLLFFGARRDER